MALQKVIKVRLRVIQVQIIVINAITVTLCSIAFRLRLHYSLLERVIPIEVLNTAILNVLPNLILNLVIGRRLLTHFRGLKLLVLMCYGRLIDRLFHLLFQLLKVLLALGFSLLFALLSSFNVDSELVTQVVGEFKFFISDVLQVGCLLLLSDILL